MQINMAKIELLLLHGITKQFRHLSRRTSKNKYAQNQKREVIDFVKNGNSIKQVSVKTEIAQSTIRSWLSKDKQ